MHQNPKQPHPFLTIPVGIALARTAIL